MCSSASSLISCRVFATELNDYALVYHAFCKETRFLSLIFGAKISDILQLEKTIFVKFNEIA